MIKLIIIGRRCAGKTRDAALAHLRMVHGPLVYDPPVDAGAMPSRYVQNHVFSPAPGSGYKDRDLVTEIWFDSFPHLGAATATPFYKTVLQPDESNFVDTENVLKGVVRQSDLHGIMPADAVKLFIVLKKHADVDPSRFATECDRAIEMALAEGQAAGFLRNTMLPPPDGGDPFADEILEFWFASAARAHAFATTPFATMMDALEHHLDDARSFHLMAEEYTVDRLRAAGKQAA